VEDLGSVHGTRVNGAAISETALLQPGDKVAIGPVVLEFGIGDPPELEQTECAPADATTTPLMLVRGEPAEQIEIEGELTLGRDSGCEVVLNDPAVSRRHALVRALPDGGCVVSDLNSSGGSFVNGHRFDSQELTVGDRLQIGPFCLQYNGKALTRVAEARGSAIRAIGITQNVGALTLLNDLTFTIPGSHFTGILGPSGAGKSTLLNTLAGLDVPEGGVVLIDGQDLYAGNERHSFGFVPQEDIVHLELTVSQALRFSARLRLPDTPGGEIERLIVQTMDQLGLRERSDHRISRLSGGQRKRVSVGVELLAKPAILFLDEPTSGLDPATEFQLMELLRRLADTGCTIVCTTHVMENAYLMDQLLVLCAGRLVFQGSAQEARSFFSVGKLTSIYDRLLEQPAEAWHGRMVKAGLGLHDEQLPAASPAAAADRPHAGARFPLPILLARQWAILAADLRNFVILLGQPLVIGGLVSWVSDDQALVMFFAYIGTLWFGCSNAAQEIVKELAVFRRERLVGVGTHSYLASKFLFLTAITALQGLLLWTVLRLGEADAAGDPGWQLAALLGTALAAVGIGSAISALSRSVMQAVLIVPLVLIPQILFSGYSPSAHEMKTPVYAVSRVMPTFAAQVMIDTSFLWRKELSRDVLRTRMTSMRNIQRASPVRTGELFTRSRPGMLALATHALWGIATYLTAWLALRGRQRA
jgi:ABC transport system ATP-binding/permease protein